jgi:hypothetical protein
MKQYKFQNRSQKNSHSCVPLKEIGGKLLENHTPFSHVLRNPHRDRKSEKFQDYA